MLRRFVIISYPLKQFLDAKGSIKIWFAKDTQHPVKKAYDNILSGKVRDVAWTPDSQRLVIVGEGQNTYISMSTPEN